MRSGRGHEAKSTLTPATPESEKADSTTPVPLASDQTFLLRVSAQPEMGVLELASEVTDLGHKVVQILPEGSLVIRSESAEPEVLTSRYTVEVLARPGLDEVTPEPSMQERGLGERPPTPEEEAYLSQTMLQATSIAPSILAEQRAQLDELEGLPTAVDNSLSQYFPPIRSQGSQGSCTAWASSYYYSTYTQAMDEGYNVSGGNNAHINSPAFMYPLINGGGDNGASTTHAMSRLTEVGCCSWTTMPYSSSDYLTWPSEHAWVEALQNRGQQFYSISGSSPAGIESIKQHLANGHIAVTRFTVYQTWYRDYPKDGPGIDNKVYYAPDGNNVGGHAVTLVGFDDNRGYVDHRDGQTHYGAFLLANSWGTGWGTYNSTGTGSKGFFWVAYSMFEEGTFGPSAYYLTDRDNYRPHLYASTGLNHSERGRVYYQGGVGPVASPQWTSYAPISYDGGTNVAITDEKPVAVDLTDGLSYIQGDPEQATLFVKTILSSAASSGGSLTTATFYEDFDGDGSFRPFSSFDPPLVVPSGQTVYATAHADPFVLSVAEDFCAYGREGGPFSPNATTWTVLNVGNETFNWNVSTTASWLSISQTSGTLVPQASVLLDIGLTPTASTLPAGSYTETLNFTNTRSSMTHAVEVSLHVLSVAELPYSATFDGGTLDPCFVSTGTGAYRTIVASSNGPRGSHHLLMDSSVQGTSSRNELTLTVDLANYEDVVLIFWAREYSDEVHSSPSSPFTNGADFDGVAISPDGKNWYTVLEFPDLFGSYTQFTVDLDAAIASYGLSYTGLFRVRFNQFDNYPIASDGIAIDDISLAGTPHGHSVILDPGAHGSIVEANMGPLYATTVAHGGAFPTVSVRADPHYAFTGWNPSAPTSITSSFECTAQYSHLDTDQDGLPDAFEQQIVDANPHDAITSLQDVDPNDSFACDGVPNLIKCAFGLDPTHPSGGFCAEGGTVPGLPLVKREDTPFGSRIVVEFLQPTGSSLTIQPVYSTVLATEGSWVPLPVAPSIITVDATWERVRYEYSYDPVLMPCVFVRVRVSST